MKNVSIPTTPLVFLLLCIIAIEALMLTRVMDGHDCETFSSSEKETAPLTHEDLQIESDILTTSSPEELSLIIPKEVYRSGTYLHTNPYSSVKYIFKSFVSENDAGVTPEIRSTIWKTKTDTPLYIEDISWLTLKIHGCSAETKQETFDGILSFLDTHIAKSMSVNGFTLNESRSMDSSDDEPYYIRTYEKEMEKAIFSVYTQCVLEDENPYYLFQFRYIPGETLGKHYDEQFDIHRDLNLGEDFIIDLSREKDFAKLNVAVGGGGSGYFMYTKEINGVWKNIYSGNGTIISCTLAEEHAFPSEIAPRCFNEENGTSVDR
ncbi:MAG: hypothetical protein H8D63_02135 [Parcubacteria group bacterium]|nr:hypothetical protein [Parcubacteria group bacterium]